MTEIEDYKMIYDLICAKLGEDFNNLRFYYDGRLYFKCYKWLYSDKRHAHVEIKHKDNCIKLYDVWGDEFEAYDLRDSNVYGPVKKAIEKKLEEKRQRYINLEKKEREQKEKRVLKIASIKKEYNL